MKLPSTAPSRPGMFRRRSQEAPERTALAPPPVSAGQPRGVRRAHGLEATQRFSLDAWLHAKEETGP